MHFGFCASPGPYVHWLHLCCGCIYVVVVCTKQSTGTPGSSSPSLALATGLYLESSYLFCHVFVAHARCLHLDSVRFYSPRDATLTIVGLELTRG